MNTLVEKIIGSEISSLFTLQDMYNFGMNKNIVKEMVREAVMNSEIIQIKDDIYTVNKIFRKEFIIDEVLAQKLVPDSYVSMESVLSDLSWIPEAVYCVTSVTRGNNRLIETKYGRYSYVNLPQKKIMAGVRIIDRGAYKYKTASPLKALADIMYERGYNWTTLEPLYKSFRIEYDTLETLTKENFDELHETYGISNVENFLIGIRKELAL